MRITYISNSKLRCPLVTANVEYRLNDVLKIYYGFVNGNSQRDENFTNEYSNTSAVPVIHTENNTEQQHIAKIDFSKNYIKDRLNIGAGAKTTFTRQENLSEYQSDMPMQYNDLLFNGQENIFGGYFSLRYKFNKKFSIYTGFRSEYTDYSIKNISDSAYSAPHYWNQIPTVIFYYQPAPWYRIQLSYRQQIHKRPSYSNLLPGNRYIDDYNYSVGNPDLKASQQHYFSFSNTFYNSFRLAFGTNLVSNFIGAIKVDRGNGITESTFMNVSDMRYYVLDATIPLRLFDEKFSANINYVYNFGDYRNFKNGFSLPKDRNKRNEMNLNAYFGYQLNDRISLEANTYYLIKNQKLQTESKPYATLDLGIQFLLLKSKRLSLNLNANDIFDSTNRITNYYYNNNVMISDVRPLTQYFQLRLSYQFNGGKLFEEPRGTKNNVDRFTK